MKRTLLREIAKFSRNAAIALTLVTCAGLGSAEIGVEDTQIMLGQSLPLSGPQATLARQRQDGALLHFEMLNDGGGIHGRKVTLLTLDDLGDPRQTLANARELIYRHRVLALFDCRGNRANRSYLPIVQAERVPYLSAARAASDDTAYHRYYFLLDTESVAFGLTSAQHLSEPSLPPEAVTLHKEYLAALALRRPHFAPEAQHFGGYLLARLLSTAIERSGRDLTREKLVTALEQLERDGLAGTPIVFTPSHQPRPSDTAPALLAANHFTVVGKATPQAQARD